MKFRQIDEEINYIVGGKDETERLSRGREVATGDGTFVTFMQIGTNPELKISGLPEGSPDTYEPTIDMPEGISDTTARQELRRIKSFLPNGTYNTLKPVKRENIWIQILEGVHWKEAAILTMIKDQTLFKEYPTLKPVLEALGIVARINKGVEIADPPSAETVTESPAEAAPAKPKKGRKPNA